ncbi:histidine kinase [Kribbella sp. NPDC048915]|uniref:sensor histidine kinase n=1 Tax=Kribbella sp. NPDC048915 TaxID=3155148 RepID=UPI0033C13BF8
MDRRRSDILLAVGVVIALSVVVTSDQGRGGAVDPLAYLWAAGLGALMLLRRRHPVLVLVLTALGFLTYHAAGFPAIGVALPTAAALYSAAEMGHVRAAAVVAGATLGFATTYRLLAGQDMAFVLGYELVSHGALMAAVIVLGHSVRTGRALRLRTAQVTRLLERQGALDADARVREDRMFLARELHDSIGHSLSVASLYTSVAREAADDGERQQALELARTGISDSLAQLRRTVALLRASSRTLDGAGPGLADLPHLAAGPAAAGYRVNLDVADISPGPEIEAAVFRIVQEAVTNTLRHSTGTTIEVSVACDGPERVSVVVADDGGPVAGAGAPDGHGLSGLAERVSDLGGTLSAGPTPSGWVVRADIPTEGETS